jgi:hypothetical protein
MSDMVRSRIGVGAEADKYNQIIYSYIQFQMVANDALIMTAVKVFDARAHTIYS